MQEKSALLASSAIDFAIGSKRGSGPSHRRAVRHTTGECAADAPRPLVSHSALSTAS